MKHTSEIVLRALLKGNKVNLDLGTMTLPCVLSEENNVCTVATKNGEEVLLPFDLDLSEFIKACERMPENERVSLVCNLTLQDF